jgi:hypothetical protein
MNNYLSCDLQSASQWETFASTGAMEMNRNIILIFAMLLLLLLGIAGVT